MKESQSATGDTSSEREQRYDSEQHALFIGEKKIDLHPKLVFSPAFSTLSIGEGRWRECQCLLNSHAESIAARLNLRALLEEAKEMKVNLGINLIQICLLHSCYQSHPSLKKEVGRSLEEELTDYCNYLYTELRKYLQGRDYDLAIIIDTVAYLSSYLMLQSERDGRKQQTAGATEVRRKQKYPGFQDVYDKLKEKTTSLESSKTKDLVEQAYRKQKQNPESPKYTQSCDSFFKGFRLYCCSHHFEQLLKPMEEYTAGEDGPIAKFFRMNKNKLKFLYHYENCFSTSDKGYRKFYRDFADWREKRKSSENNKCIGRLLARYNSLSQDDGEDGKNA